MNDRWFGIDPGSASNAFALAGVERLPSGMFCPIMLREWIPRPGAPLDIRMHEGQEAAHLVRALGGEIWATDAYAISDVRIVSAERGLRVIVETSDVAEQWRHTGAALARGRLALAPRRGPAALAPDGRPWVDPDDLAAVVTQLRTVTKEPGEQGKIRVRIPEREGLHGDLARALARALWLARAADDAPVPSRYRAVGVGSFRVPR